MRIAILETGRPPAEVIDRFGDYPARMRNWLTPALPEATFETVPAIDGDLPGDPVSYDGYVITGSKHGVYDDLPWIGALSDFIARAARADVPQVGICFGHQIAAEALGGHAAKSGRGWGIGRQRYSIDLGDGQPEIGVLVFHQDQVETLPPGARVIGGNDFCPYGAIRYAQPVISVQFHPEFTTPFIRGLLDVRERESLSREIADAARASLTADPENARVGRWAARFLRGESID